MPHIFLYGPPGTGKSTVGKILCANLSLPFVDLDQVIETKADMPIRKIMKQQGKSAFRSLGIFGFKSTLRMKRKALWPWRGRTFA